MAISIAMFGYVAARGRPSRINDPKSAFNNTAIEDVIRFANMIDGITPLLLRRGFTSDGNGSGCLRRLSLEVDLERRTELHAILKEMGRRGGMQGTLIVPSLRHIARSGIGQTSAERAAILKIDMSAVAIICLDDPAVQRAMSKEPHALSAPDIIELVMAGADKRQTIRRWVDALDTSNIEPVRVDPDESAPQSQYRFKKDARYRMNPAMQGQLDLFDST
jgi:hypothetical protein